MQLNREYGNNVLDLILKHDESGEDDLETKIIYEYQPSQEIGAKILKDFLGFYNKRAKAFPLGDGSNAQKFGTITDIMALSTFLELKSLDVDMGSSDTLYYSTLEKVFADIYKDGRIVFDATPYWNNEGYEITTYVETASKLISTMVDLRDDLIQSIQKKKNKMPALNIRGKEVSRADELLELVEEIIIDAVKMLNEAALPVAEPYEYRIDGKRTERGNINPVVTCRGWAFQNPGKDKPEEYESSLYYTYFGTNAFTSIYNSMESFYDYLDGGERLYGNIDESNLRAEERQKLYKFNKDERFYEKYKKELDILRNLTASAGRHIETQLKANGVNIAFDYVDKELKKVSIDTISSGRNNHVMNSLFAFAILINAGVDDDYASVGKSNIFQTILFALTNIKKIYLEYKDEKREDLIDNYSLGEDRCPGEVSMIMQSWRKSGSISTYDLVPLYCNTYNLVFNYIIKYPQKEMRDNLVWLLENKSAQGWYWAKEGFSINNNLYYVYALDSFYSYYNQYEADFLDADGLRKKLNDKEREIIHEKVKSEAVIQKNNAEHERALAEAMNRRSPLDTEVEKLVEKYLDRKFGEYFANSLDEYIENGMDFVLRMNQGGERERDKYVAEFNSDKRLQRIFSASSIELSGNIVQGKSIADMETDKQKERLYREFYNEILKKLYRI